MCYNKNINNLNKIMDYPIVFIPVAAGCIAQFIKFALSTAKSGKIEVKYILGPGHMPSAHSAFVVSLAMVIACFDGIFSTTFAISIVLAYIVIYDALIIRTNIGYNGKVINKLVKESSGIKKGGYPVMKEVVGHSFWEVAVGSFLGFAFSALFLIALG